jgi:multidrug transporter EmrE-like cation transporter
MNTRRVIVRSAVLGFSVTAAFVAYQLITDMQSPISRNPALMILFVVLCPPSLLSLAFNNMEVGSGDFYSLWAVIGVVNAGLYGSARLLMLRLPRKAK